jgi:hypothetical protein
MLNTTNAIGWKAIDFVLSGIDGKTYSLAEVRGPKGTDHGRLLPLALRVMCDARRTSNPTSHIITTFASLRG